MRERIERWLIYGIVLLAVLVPVDTTVDLSSVFVQDEPLTEDTGAAYLVDQWAITDKPVLVAFDYDPSYMGELHLPAEAVLRHLARNEAQIITIGLTPEGAGLAQQAIDDVWSAEDRRAGEGYVNLGYLPGEAVGIRSLEFLPQEFQQWTFDGRELRDVPAPGDDDDFALSNMSLIIVLSSLTPTLATQFTMLINIATLLYLVIYAYCCAALWRSTGNSGIRLVALLAGAFCLWAIAASDGRQVAYLALLCALGVPLYLGLRNGIQAR